MNKGGAGEGQRHNVLEHEGGGQVAKGGREAGGLVLLSM